MQLVRQHSAETAVAFQVCSGFKIKKITNCGK